jgi:hypothetical protein
MVQKELRKLSQWFFKGFLKWYDGGGGGNGVTSKRIFEVEEFFSSQNINFPFIWRDSWSFFFSSPLFFFFFFCSISWGLGVLMIFEEKITSSKLLFKWLEYTSGGHIFQNGVMRANMAKPWLWRWGNCGYIGDGHIFQSGVMHANIFGWG